MPQGLSFTPRTGQPQQAPSRDVSGGAIGLLQQLLGREGQPTLPPIQRDSNSDLASAFNEAQGIDPEKRRRIAEILSGRSRDDIARGPQPAGPQTPGMTSAEPEISFLDSISPFGVAGAAMGDALRAGGQQ